MIGRGAKATVLLVGLMALTSVVGLAAGLGLPAVPAVGSGNGTVSAPPVKVTDVKWVLATADPTKLDKVTVDVDHTIGLPTTTESYDIYIALKDSGGNVLGTPVPVRQTPGINGEPVSLTFSYFGQNVLVSSIASISVTACNPDALNTCQ